jgi:hypothetical protein
MMPPDGGRADNHTVLVISTGGREAPGAEKALARHVASLERERFLDTALQAGLK